MGTFNQQGAVFWECSHCGEVYCSKCAFDHYRGDIEKWFYPGEAIHCDICGDRVRATVTEYPEVRVTQSPILGRFGVSVKFKGGRLTQTSTLAGMGIYVKTDQEPTEVKGETHGKTK